MLLFKKLAKTVAGEMTPEEFYDWAKNYAPPSEDSQEALEVARKFMDAWKAGLKLRGWIGFALSTMAYIASGLRAKNVVEFRAWGLFVAGVEKFLVDNLPSFEDLRGELEKYQAEYLASEVKGKAN